ncbi:MAG: POTRA domain-containing protein [Caulobacteraceae bacterium]
MAATLIVGAVTAASAAHVRSYILNGYSFGGFPGVNTDELAAKLKDQEGARVTQADISVDEAILTKELQARHIEGRLFTSIAEKHGRIWIIFDLQNPGGQMARFWKAGHHLKAENFEGASRVSTSDLAAATGLKEGDLLSREKIDAARQAILALYAKSMPGKVVSVRGRMQSNGQGELTLTWMITEK